MPYAAAQTKYRAKPTIVDGIRFASQHEANRYGQLVILQKAGAIKRLELQPRYPLHVVNTTTGEITKIGHYVADFRYIEKGEWVIEDAKGFKTPMYRLKKRLFEAQYGLQIQEV